MITEFETRIDDLDLDVPQWWIISEKFGPKLFDDMFKANLSMDEIERIRDKLQTKRKKHVQLLRSRGLDPFERPIE